MEPEQEKLIPRKADAKLVETYAEDMATAIGDNREGLIKQIIHQEEEDELEKTNASPEVRKNNFFLVAGAFLIVLTVVILGVSSMKKEAATVPVEKQFTPIIFNDSNIFLEVAGLNKEKVLEAFANTVNKASLKNGEVEGIYLTENKKIIGLKRFLEILGTNFVIPTDLDASVTLVSDNFLTGVVQGEGEKGVFILIKTRSSSDIFPALRTWENKMFLDMHDFVGTELSSVTKYLLIKSFEDTIIENKNARILYEDEVGGERGIVMMYVFANDNSVVITNTTEAAREIISRLSAGRIKK
jgi:hypothetical protein